MGIHAGILRPAGPYNTVRPRPHCKEAVSEANEALSLSLSCMDHSKSYKRDFYKAKDPIVLSLVIWNDLQDSSI